MIAPGEATEVILEVRAQHVANALQASRGPETASTQGRFEDVLRREYDPEHLGAGALRDKSG